MSTHVRPFPRERSTRRRRLGLGLGAALVLGAMLAVVVVGVVDDFYTELAWLDELVHTLTYLGLAMLLAVVIDASGATRTVAHRALFAVSVFLITLGAGATWEIAEWLWATTANRGDLVPDKFVSMLDLVFDSLGALLGSLLGVIVLTAHRPDPEHTRQEARR